MIISILKIIGFILIGILAFILVILAYVLFSPILADAKFNFNESDYSFKVHDALRLFYVQVSHKNGILKTDVAFLFKLIKPKKKDSSDKNKTKETLESDEAKIESNLSGNEEVSPNEESSSKKKPPKKNDTGKIIKNIVNSEAFMPLIKALGKELLFILKAILPKKGSADLAFCAGSPDITGYICGVLSMLPWTYKKGYSFNPDFVSEKAYLNGQLSLMFYIFPVIFVISGLRIVTNKNFWKIITVARKKNFK